MRPTTDKRGFTLVEVLIGMTLSLMVMGAVLSGYVYLGRNFTRSLGLSSANEPTLESQGRRTLALFAQDVRMASGVDPATRTAPEDTFANSLKIFVPASDGNVATGILYYYNGATTPAYLHASGLIDLNEDTSGVEFPPGTLTRVVLSTPRSAVVLHRNLVSCEFSYFDLGGNAYTAFSQTEVGFSSLTGIKQIALSFSSQAGNSTNGTLTPVYSSTSPRMLLRNKQSQP